MRLNCKYARAAIWILTLGPLVPLSAQVTGSLSGSVEDVGGKPLAGVRVVVSLPDSNAEEAATTTTTNGSFFFPVLRPIFYTLTITSPDYKTQSLTNVKIDPTRDTSLPPLQLARGDQGTVDRLPAPTQTLQTSSSEVSFTLTQEQVSALPLAARDPLAPLGLLDTLPGVVYNGRAPTTIDGQSVSFANVTYDGINIQDNFIRNFSLQPTDVLLGLHTDQISEATIVTSNPGTIYTGGSSQVAFSTPSGTNEFHGSLYWLNIPRGIGAKTFFQANSNNLVNPPNLVELNQAGATVGGPIVKNKFFFFANFEADLDRSTVIQQGSVPTSPLVSTNATVQQILNLIPTNPSGFYSGTQNDGNTTYLGLARLDYVASSKHVFSFSTSNNQGLQDAPGISSIFGRQPDTTLQTVARFFSGSWRWTPTPRLTNEVRAGFSLQRLDFEDSLRSKYPFIILFGLANEPMTGYDPQGQNNRIYNYQDNLTYVRGSHSFQAGFSLQQYRVSEYGISNGLDTSVTYPIYQMYTTDAAGNFISGIHNGTVYQELQPFNFTSPTSGYVPYSPPVTKPSANLVSGYIQDNWKVSTRFSVNLGVHYDYLSPVKDDSGLAILPFLGTGGAADAILNPNLAFEFTPKGSGLYHSDKNNFAPYAGFAWQPAKDLPIVVRGAYSISYVNDDLLRNMSQFADENGFQSFLAPNLKLGNGTLLSNVPAIPAPATPSLTLPALLLQHLQNVTYFNGQDVNFPSGIFAVDPDLRTPYVQQANLGVETQWKKFLFSVRYVGNRLEKGLLAVDRNQVNLSPQYLQFYSQYANVLAPFFNSFPQEAGETARQLQICAFFTSCTQLLNQNHVPFSASSFNFYSNPYAPSGAFVLSNLGRSRYDSLQIGVTRRVSPGLSMTANYVYSKTLSNIDDYQQGAVNPYLDLHNPSLDFAPSPFNLKHAFKATAIYDLPFGRDLSTAGLAHKIFGGWSISGVMIAQSGAPFSLLSSLGTFNNRFDSQENGLSTNLTAGQIAQTFGIQKSGDGTVTYVNAPASDFSEPGPGQVGNLQRRMFTGPNAFNLDLGLRKVIAVTERARVELRAESINILNNENWLVGDQLLNPVSTSSTATFFPSITQWTPPRSFQFLLRVRF